MSAVTINGSIINLSYYYDCLTVYPKYSTSADKINSCMSLCSKFPFVKPNLTAEQVKASALLQHQNSCFNKLTSMGVNRSVARDDNDHNLYHQDSFGLDNTHYHIKFFSILRRDQLTSLLKVFLAEDLLSQDEIDKLMKAYDKRITLVTGMADNIVAEAKEGESARSRKDRDIPQLKDVIASCADNDVLAELHKYLLTESFDYLREITEEHPSKEWQTVDRNDKVVPTSKAWAGLVKAIKLQMAKNLVDHMNFTPEQGKERAGQLTLAHNFFKLKSTVLLANPNAPRKDKTLAALERGDTAKVLEKYEKAFGHR